MAGFWGLTFPLGKIVLQVLHPFSYLATRFTLGAALLVLAVPAARLAIPPRRWLEAGAVGTVFFLGYALQTFGLRLTTASKAAFITGLSAAFVPVISAIWLRRRPRALVLAGIAVATVGLGLLTLEGAQQTAGAAAERAGRPGWLLGAATGITAGDLLVFGCAICFALHIVLVGRLTRAMEPVAFAAAQALPVAALSTVGAVAFEPALPGLALTPGVVWALIGFMALTGTVAALLVQVWAQRFTTPSHTGLMFTFEPVAAALAAYLILGEVLGARQALGAGLILAGILAVELRSGEETI